MNLMNLEKFIENVAAQYISTQSEEISATTAFRELDEWDSLLSLSIIGMIKNVYNVKLYGIDINSVNTVEELFNLVKAKCSC